MTNAFTQSNIIGTEVYYTQLLEYSNPNNSRDYNVEGVSVER